MLVLSNQRSSAHVFTVETGMPIGPPLTHAGIVNQASFSPDGRYVVTASDDATAQIWKVGSGEKVATMTHQAEVKSAAFSADGKKILTASWDTTAQFWDMEFAP